MHPLFAVVMILVVGHLEPTDPDTIFYSRSIFFLTHILIFGLCIDLYNKIQRTADQTMITLREGIHAFANPLYARNETTTHQAHDMTKFYEMIYQKLAPSTLVIAVVHYYWGYLAPLLLHSVNVFNVVWSSEVFQVYTMGKKAVGDLQRPWKVHIPIFLQKMAWGATSADAAAAADKKRMKAEKRGGSSSAEKRAGKN